MQLKQITYAEIMEHDPCYDPAKIGMPIDYSANPIEFIQEYRHKVRKLDDINWVMEVLLVLPIKQSKLYAIWCARQVGYLMKDKRSIKALDIAEAYINDNATLDELIEAKNAAHDAAAAAYAAAAYDAAAAYADAAAAAVFAAAAAVFAAAAAYAACAYAANAAEKGMRNKQIDKLIEILTNLEKE